MEATWPPKSMIFRSFKFPRGLQKFIIFWHRFFIDLGSVLASNLEASWEPRGLKIQKKGGIKIRVSPPQSGSEYDLSLEHHFGIDFGGVRARISMILG